MTGPKFLAAKDDALLEWWSASHWELTPSSDTGTLAMTNLLLQPAVKMGGTHAPDDLDVDELVRLKVGTQEHAVAVLRNAGWDVAET